jgi:general bacterial porin, GBP family
MRKYLIPTLLCAATSSAWAQSSVSLYGIASTAIAWTSNAGGHGVAQELSGANQNNRWGLLISEDLGGGVSTVARLESGYFITNGGTGQNGRMFGRQAYIGLSDERAGTLTFGRQYDATFDFTAPYSISNATGMLLSSPGDVDNTMGSWRFNNSVKYLSPTIAGIDAELMYAFSNQAGDFALNRAYSAGLRYRLGPLQLAAAYTQMDGPGNVNPNGAVTNDYAGPAFFLFRASPLNSAEGVARQRTLAFGGRYVVSPSLQLNAMIDAVRFKYLDGTSLALDNYHVSVSYLPAPLLTLAAGYIYTSGRYGGLDANPHWNSVQLLVDYALSKRTDIYLFDDYQRRSGPLQVNGVSLAGPALYLNEPSSSNVQNMVAIGIRHRF